MDLSPIKANKKARIGLYSIGHPHYWNQFAGMRERLIEYGQFIADKIGDWAEVVNFGMVDNEATAHEAGEWFNQQNVDLLFCHSATYALSADVLPVTQICSRPVVVLNLQPAAKMNYPETTTGEWLAHCGACPVPELSNAFVRAGIDFHVVSGLLGLEQTPDISLADEVTAEHPDAIRAWTEIEEWVKAATVKRTLEFGRMGMLGHTYPGMLDLYSDFTMIQAQTGLHVELLEMCDLFEIERDITEAEIAAKLKETTDFFEISKDDSADPLAKKPTEEQMNASCRTAVALEKLARKFNIDGLTYYYRGIEGHDYQRIQESFILGHSLLTGRGMPCSGEGDMKTCIAMKIGDICGVGGSFCEIVAADFELQTMILGHDGPFHIGISDAKPVLRGMGLYHGKWGSGISVEASVKKGPVTCVGITQSADGRLKMIANEGEAVAGDILRIGNTMTHVKFNQGPSTFMDEWFAMGPTHHFAMTIGHNKALFKKLATIMNWEFDSVC